MSYLKTYNEKMMPNGVINSDSLGNYTKPESGIPKSDLSEEVQETLNSVEQKQETLVSGENIKTINNESILGEGNIAITAQTYVIDNTPEADSNNLVKSSGVAREIVWDVTARNSNATFASLSALLSDANLATLIPTTIRRGGMQIRFVHSNDNNYVQFRYTKSDASTAATFTNTANWQGVDDTPTVGSQNLVISGGVESLSAQLSKFVKESLALDSSEEEDITSEYSDSLMSYATTEMVLKSTETSYKMYLYNLLPGNIYKVHRQNSEPGSVMVMFAELQSPSDLEVGKPIFNPYYGNSLAVGDDVFYVVTRNTYLVVLGSDTNAERYSKVYKESIIPTQNLLDLIETNSDNIQANAEDIDQISTKVDSMNPDETFSVENDGQNISAYINAVSKLLTSSSSKKVWAYPLDGISGVISVYSPLHSQNRYISRWGLAANRMQMNGEFIAVSSAATETTGKTEEINLSNYPTAKYVYVCYDHNESGVPSVTYKKGKLEVVIEQIESMRDVEIVMPDKIDAVVGDTLQLFYRGMILAVNPYNYDIVVDCGKGQQLPRYFTYTPNVSDVGTRSFRLMVKDVGGEMLADKTISLVTKDVPSSPSSQKNVVIFGASTTVNGEWAAEAYRRLTGSGGSPTGLALNNISFCGALTKNGAGYFGVGGWDWSEYVTAGRSAYRFQVTGVTSLSPGAVYSNNGYNFTLLEVNVTGSSGNILMYYTQTGAAPTSSGTLTKVSGNGDETITFTSYASDSANPLWDYTNNKMTFVPYANTYCDGQIDYVITLLGTNGLTVDQSDFSAKIANAKTFADTLHSEFPNAKMIILGSQVPSCHGGLGYNYGAVANSFSNRLGLMRSQFGLRKAYQDMANEDGYSSFVKYVDLASQFDSDYNYPFYQFNVNTRNTEKERIDNNGVHPAECGYMQIADAVYRVLCNEISVLNT